MKILLVDDDLFLRDMYATKFTEKGDDVLVAESGEEALRMLEDSSFDAVVTDIVMPGMSGIDLIKKVKEGQFGEKCKCVVLSNQGEAFDIDLAEKAGAVGYIIKAESMPSEVVEKVHQLV